MINDADLTYIKGKWYLDRVLYSGVSKTTADTYLWYENGKLHREDGPSCIRKNGTMIWHIHGKRHREDGPAYNGAEGSKYWFIHDKPIHTWKEYHELSTLTPQQQMIVKLRYGEQLK